MREEFVCPRDKSIIIFGGHEDWIKGIKRIIKGVKIVKENCPNDTKKVKNADEIWIQNNAISHSLYRKILAISREKKIPLHYFSFSSPIKCAQQFIQEYAISS